MVFSTIIILLLSLVLLWQGLDGNIMGMIGSLLFDIIAMMPIIVAFNIDMENLNSKILFSVIPIVLFFIKMTIGYYLLKTNKVTQGGNVR